MKDLSINEISDLLTSKLAGITVIDQSHFHPEFKKALYVEGERDYYLDEDAHLNYVLKDSFGQVKLSLDELDLTTFFQKVIHLILEEEDETVIA